MGEILSLKDYQVTSVDYPEVDITNKASVVKAMADANPEIVVNCAAYTDVDGCEANIERVFAVNAEGVKNIAEVCKKIAFGDNLLAIFSALYTFLSAKKIKAKLIHYSTDYIFAGKKNQP